MGNWFVIRKTTLDRLFLVPRFHGESLFLLHKRTVALWLFYAGILCAFFCTLCPWFLWPLAGYPAVVASLFLVPSFLLSRTLSNPIYGRPGFLLPTLAILLLLLVMSVSSGRNVNGIFMAFFSTLVYLSVFYLRVAELQRLGRVLTLAMALILCVSIPAFVLHLAGFPFPHRSVSFQDYQFDNYLFFLVDMRFNFELIPRFHSVFLEPSHLGMACIALLYSQIGRWNTWPCRVLFLALLMSFSLAAYLCLVVMLFSAAWMKGKSIIGKIVLLSVLGGAMVVGSIFYNRGDNLVNQLIVQRLALNEEGNIEGDNRTTDLFTREYEKAIDSGDILLGRGMEEVQKFGFGNAGYRVYIYTYGLVTLFFLVLFFAVLSRTSPNRRAVLSMLLIELVTFIPHAQPIRFYTFIPYYILMFSTVYPVIRKSQSSVCPARTHE